MDNYIKLGTSLFDPSIEKHKDNLINQNRFFVGTVISSDPGTFNVRVAASGMGTFSVYQGICLTSQLAHALGMKESCLPAIGADVLCMVSDFKTCLVLGVIPKHDDFVCSPGSYFERALHDAGDGNADARVTAGYAKKVTKALLFNNLRPTDVNDGEYTLSNEFGILLGLFQQFAVLKASELAQVQTFVLDDLVRIISHNFQHYTCLGEHSIFHDGKRLYMEFSMTHDPREALGQPQVDTDNNNPVFQSINDSIKNSPDDTKNFVEFTESERLTGIARLKGFVGALGDFVNLLLVRPAQELRKLDGTGAETTPDRGLFNCHLASDGGLYVRSLKGIFLEKTNWIRVPQRIRTPEDPEGDDATNIDYSKTDFKFDSKTIEGQPYLYFLQLRDYLSYIQENLSYNNFKKHQKDFVVNDDINKEVPLESIQKVHPDVSVRYEPRTSGIYLMPNGGVTIKDAWGSAIVMEGGQIYLQPARDLMVQPLRHFVAKVGDMLSIAVKNDLDFSSTDGGFRLKTDKAQYFYSDTSGIILHSNTNFLGGVYPVNDVINEVSGIVLYAPKSGIYSKSLEIYYNAQNVGVFSSRRVDVHASELARLTSDGKAQVFSQEETLLTSERSTLLTARKDLLAFGYENTLLGVDREISNRPIAVGSFGPVYGIIPEDQLTRILDKLDEFGKFASVDLLHGFNKDESFENIKFRFPDSKDYKLIENIDFIPQTLRQQELILMDQVNNYWKEKSVNDTFPFPGVDFADSYVTSNLQNLDVVNFEIYNKSSGHKNEGVLQFGANIFKDYVL